VVARISLIYKIPEFIFFFIAGAPEPLRGWMLGKKKKKKKYITIPFFHPSMQGRKVRSMRRRVYNIYKIRKYAF